MSGCVLPVCAYQIRSMTGPFMGKAQPRACQRLKLALTASFVAGLAIAISHRSCGGSYQDTFPLIVQSSYYIGISTIILIRVSATSYHRAYPYRVKGMQKDDAAP